MAFMEDPLTSSMWRDANTHVLYAQIALPLTGNRATLIRRHAGFWI